VLLAPLFLLGLLAIGLPLWLHRFSRETREKQPFASLMLIEASQIIRSRKHTLKYLLLLALRIALLVAVVLAFTEPALPWRTPPLEVRDRTLHVVVLDTSLSMRQGQRWQRALEQAQTLIGAIRPSDQGVVVAADSRIRIVRGPVDGNAKEELRAALTGLQPGFARLDYGMLMTSATSFMGTQLPRTRLHVITDLQQTASPLRFADLEPPPGVQLDLVDVGDASASNLHVEALATSAQDSNALEARVNGASTQPREIILTIDGKEQGRRSLEAGTGERRVTFPAVTLGDGQHRAMAALEPKDSLPHDDQFYAVLERRVPRALVISANVAGDDGAYFAAAVGSLTSPRLAVERSAANDLARRTLTDYSALVVSDVGILSDDAVDLIEAYLQGGGAVLTTLGPRAAGRDALPLSGHERPGTGLLGGGARRADQPGRVSDVEQSHPALRDAEGWRSVRFFRFVPIEPTGEDSVLIRFETGAPLLVERRIGAGRLLLLTSPLDREWNDLAIHPLFVRFVGEAARYLTGASATASALVGSLLPMGSGSRAGAQVFDPRGQRVLELGDTAGRARRVADTIGFYEVRGGGKVDWIAVNADPRESNLARLPPASIARWKSLQPPANAAGGTSATDVASHSLKALWPWLLVIAVTLAFVEALMANSYLHVRRGVTS
jgi:hypothetical protein